MITPIKSVTKPYLNKSKTKYYLFDYQDHTGKIIKGKSLKTTDLKESLKNSEEFIIDLKVEYRMACKLEENKQLDLYREPIVYHQRQIGHYQVSIKESFSSVFQDFIDSKGGSNCKEIGSRSQRTRKDYIYVQKMLNNYGFDWGHLTKTMFRRFIQYLGSTKKLSPITIAKRMVYLKVFLNYCVTYEILPQKLVSEVSRIMPVVPKSNQGHSKTIPMNVSKSLFSLLARDNNLEFAQYLYILYVTTSRSTEIRLLKKSLYHAQSGSLHIRQFKTSDWKCFEDVQSSLKAILDQLIASSDSDYFFPNAINDERYFSDQWRKYMKELNLIESKDKYGKEHCFYEMRCIRHTSASEILKVTKDPDIVRCALGHNTNTSHSKTYTKDLEVLIFPPLQTTNHGKNKNISRYAQCTKIVDSSIFQQLSITQIIAHYDKQVIRYEINRRYEILLFRKYLASISPIFSNSNTTITERFAKNWNQVSIIDSTTDTKSQQLLMWSDPEVSIIKYTIGTKPQQPLMSLATKYQKLSEVSIIDSTIGTKYQQLLKISQ